jgi:phosphatidate cytidylyltransferase
MSNFLKRLILTLVSVPLMILSVFWPQDNHIIMIVAFLVFIPLLGSYEMSNLMYAKGIGVRRWFLPLVNSLIFIFSYLYMNDFFNVRDFKPSLVLFFAALIALTCYILARDIFKKDLTHSLEKMSTNIFSIIYIGVPSFIAPAVLNFAHKPVDPAPVFYNIEANGTLEGSMVAFFMLTLILSNDIFAYVWGMLLGKGNVIGLTASPKKSWAGYIGAFLSSFAWVFIFWFFLFRHYTEFPWWLFFTFPLLTGFTVPIGDLVESVIKRSANVKDSGKMIMGRGGVLDSIDSLLYNIPIIFIIFQVYFAFTGS